MRIAKLILSTLFTICILGLVAGGVLYFHLKSSLPSVESLKTVELQQPMQIYTADGKLIGEVGEQRRIPVKLENVPQRLQDAFLATEDSRFYDHHGLDPVGIARAIFVAVNNGGASQGASTITQQLAQLARDAVAPYAKAGKVRFYQSGAEVVPGMRSHPSPGHTPGHNGIEFTSKGQTMLVWGDLMHNHTLQMLDPEIAIEFDSDPKQARASRQDALKDAATRKI